MRGHRLQKQQREQFHDIVHKPAKPSRIKQFATSRNIRIGAGVVVLAMLLLVGLSYRAYRNTSQSSEQTTAQKQRAEELVAEASTELKPQDAEKLGDTVSQIQTTENYQDNQDLLYVSLEYYISVSDTKNARATYDQLVKVYDEKRGFSSTLGNPLKTINDFKVSVEFLESQDKQTLKNAWGS